MNLKSANRDSLGKAMLKSLLWLVPAAVMFAGILGTYYWQHQAVQAANQQVIELQRELANATATNKPGVQPTAISSYKSQKGVILSVFIPTSTSTVASPLIIMGEVPGNWSFEASFPIKLLDGNGTVIAQAPARVIGDWMTDKPVPFTAQLTYANAPPGNGTLMLQKDNPSGLESNADSVSIPVKL